MRQIILSAWTTLDGFVAAPDGTMGWLRGDDEMMAYEQSFVDGADTLLLGRVTFGDFAGYWPRVAKGEAPEDGQPVPDAQQQAYARRLEAMEKIVVSAVGDVAEWGSRGCSRRSTRPRSGISRRRRGERSLCTGA
ncbi:MAG: dihydrofolate reductase family protein [Candidatus Rokuibacteriota bacterium]